MLRGLKNAIFDRTNRGGAVEAADSDEGAAEIACYSESSGPETANDPVLDSDSSTRSSLLSDPPDNPTLWSNNANTMHHETEGDATRELRRKWHFTQYGYRQFEQRKMIRQ